MISDCQLANSLNGSQLELTAQFEEDIQPERTSKDDHVQSRDTGAQGPGLLLGPWGKWRGEKVPTIRLHWSPLTRCSSLPEEFNISCSPGVNKVEIIGNLALSASH